MATRRKDSVIYPVLEDSTTISGMGLTTRAPLLLTPQNPSHEWAISTLNNTIQITNIIGDVVPAQVVKGAMSSIAAILGIVKNTFANQSDFQELAEQCQRISLVVWDATSRASQHQLDAPIHRALTNLKSSVDGILEEVKEKADKNPMLRAFHATLNQETITKWRNELNRLLTLFNTELNISTNLKLDELLSLFQAFRSTVTSNLQTDIQVSDALPARPRVFVGRDDLVLSTVEALLECRHVALIGAGGIGKSSIARAVLNDEAIASKFQDRRYFVRFDNIDATQVNLGTFLDHVARGLGLSNSANAHNLITRVLSTLETLLVLDNAETFLDAAVDAGRIADTIDGFGARSNVAILLTTRTTVLPPNLEWVRLRVAFLPQGISKTRLTAIFPGVSNLEICADALCRQSLAYVNGDFITLLAPIRLDISKRYNTEISMNPLLKRIRSYYGAHVEEKEIVVSDDMNIEHVLIHWLRDTEGRADTILDVLITTNRFLPTLWKNRPRPISMRPVISALDVSKSHNSLWRMNFCMTIPMLRKHLPFRIKSTCLVNISYIMCLTGQTEEATKAHIEARTLALKVGDLDQLAFIDWALASSYRWRGDFQTAENLLQTALKYCSRLSNVFRLTWTMKALVKLNMITINIIKGTPDAVQSGLKSLPTLRRKHIQYYISNINFLAGFLELHNGHLDIAKKFFEEIPINDDEDIYQRWRRLIGLTELADRQGDHAESKALRAQLLEWMKRIPDQTYSNVNTAKALHAGYLAMEGDVEHARELIVPLAQHTTKYLYLEAGYYKYLAGMVELADENFDKARDYFHESIEDSISSAELVFHARSHRALGEIAVVKGDLKAARKHFETTTELCETMGLPRERLYFDYTCYIPSKTFDGWKLYQEGHAMFNGVVDRQGDSCC